MKFLCYFHLRIIQPVLYRVYRSQVSTAWMTNPSTVVTCSPLRAQSQTSGTLSRTHRTLTTSTTCMPTLPCSTSCASKCPQNKKSRGAMNIIHSLCLEEPAVCLLDQQRSWIPNRTDKLTNCLVHSKLYSSVIQSYIWTYCLVYR